jgi:hypothetical protein
MKRMIFISFLILIMIWPGILSAADLETRIQQMEDTLKKQQQIIADQQIIINELKGQVTSVERTAIPATAKKSDTSEVPQKASALFGGSVMNNPNISLILNTFAYGSNLKKEEIENRGLPGYATAGIDRKSGFNLESAELFLFAPVDHYFNLYATIPVTEDGAELEEAYFVTTSLPQGHQIKGGKFKSGFGRLNAQHPHAWDFVDIALPYRAFLGKEGLIEKGVQYTYLAPLPFYALIGLEYLQGDNDTLFGADATGGPHAYGAFAKASFDIGSNSTILFGPSFMFGKTKTSTVRVDSELTGDAALYGLEMTYKWRPDQTQSFVLQSEYLLRDQDGNLRDTVLDSVERLERRQDGLYVQGIYQWNRWRLGARYDALGIMKDDYKLAGRQQDFGRTPWRTSGMLEYNFTEFSRIRFQYTYDDSARDGRVNNEFFLQFIFGIGAHAAHPF